MPIQIKAYGGRGSPCKGGLGDIPPILVNLPNSIQNTTKQSYCCEGTYQVSLHTCKALQGDYHGRLHTYYY